MLSGLIDLPLARTRYQAFKALYTLTPAEVDAFLASYRLFEGDWSHQNGKSEAQIADYYHVLNYLCALGNVEKDAALADRGGQRIIGEVELEIPVPGRSNRRTELEVDVMGLPALKTFLVVIDDRVVGAFRTDDRGSFDMEIQEGEVPVPATAF